MDGYITWKYIGWESLNLGLFFSILQNTTLGFLRLQCADILEDQGK